VGGPDASITGLWMAFCSRVMLAIQRIGAVVTDTVRERWAGGTNMRAAILATFGEPLSVETVTLVEPGPHDVVVRVGASGVCHSDVTVAEGRYPFPLPLILGHEGAGVVEAVGSEVTRVAVGDRVITSVITACGACWWCVHGEHSLCIEVIPAGDPNARRADLGEVRPFAGLGTFAELMRVTERRVVKVESDLPDEQLALIGCGVLTGVGAAVNTARVTPGSSVAVIGCGGVGQAILQGARIAGATQIIAVDPVALKRKTALEVGATDAVDPTDGDVVDRVRALARGRGVDFAFEAIGRGATVVQALECVRNGGTAIAVGSLSEVIPIPGMAFRQQGKRLVASVGGSSYPDRDYQRLVDLAEGGRLDVGSMVSRTITLDEVNDAFRAMDDGEVVRSVITQFSL
jgi:S-(hydroxymethyl)glutathione dehydrogenase / alcohol dehydrogenase